MKQFKNVLPFDAPASGSYSAIAAGGNDLIEWPMLRGMQSLTPY